MDRHYDMIKSEREKIIFAECELITVAYHDEAGQFYATIIDETGKKIESGYWEKMENDEDYDREEKRFISELESMGLTLAMQERGRTVLLRFNK